jgi:hypothetical protein
LDERIGQRQRMERIDENRVVHTSLHRVQYQGIADTIVQLIRRGTRGLIGPHGRLGQKSNVAESALERGQ